MPRWSPGRMQPPLRARSFQSDRRCRSLSASAIRPVRHSAPLRLSMIARPHEVGLVDFWRADSLSQSMARSRNYPMCKNSYIREMYDASGFVLGRIRIVEAPHAPGLRLRYAAAMDGM